MGSFTLLIYSISTLCIEQCLDIIWQTFCLRSTCTWSYTRVFSASFAFFSGLGKSSAWENCNGSMFILPVVWRSSTVTRASCVVSVLFIKHIEIISTDAPTWYFTIWWDWFANLEIRSRTIYLVSRRLLRSCRSDCACQPFLARVVRLPNSRASDRLEPLLSFPRQHRSL